MKKLLMLLILGMTMPQCPKTGHAMSNRDDYQRWRSTDVTAAQNMQFVSSGCPCVIFDVTVTSGAQNPGQSGFQFMWSTNTVNLGSSFQQFTATSPFMDTSQTGARFMIDEVVVSSSFFYNKNTSFGTVRLRWDYFYSAPKGLERKGLKP